MKVSVAGIMGAGVAIAGAVAAGILGASGAKAGDRVVMTDEQVARVQAIVSNWKAPAFAALPVVQTPDPAPVPSVRPEPRLDQANALAAAAETQVGPCRFNETEWRIEIQESAFKL